MTVYSIRLTKKAERDLAKIPRCITRKFKKWFEHVALFGVVVVRKTKSYHDEPLQGVRFGQRSIRLNRAYRAFYIEKFDNGVKFIEVREITKHVY